MKVIEINSLDQLVIEADKLRRLLSNNRRHDYASISKVLFRGQSCDSWNLQTSLERYSTYEFEIGEYDSILRRISHAISAFTDKKWNIECNEDFDLSIQPPPNYEFMVYARHHGFPTPLLDWTESLYVALFFAYQKANVKSSDKVSVYAYIESLDGIKSGWEGEANIRLLGPYVTSHKRHFIQQGHYTISYKKDSNGYWMYSPHEEAFEKSIFNDGQDVLFKFNLPINLKIEILKKLNEMNINAFTLYSNEEALMETLAFKEFRLEED